MADIKDKDTVQHLYHHVLPKLAERAYAHLTEVIPLFHDFGLEKVVDTWTKDQSNPSEKPISLENGNVSQMGLRLQLLGFQRPGLPAFDVAKDLVLKLEHTSYAIGPDRTTTWLEKLYGQPWTPSELDEIAHRWSEEVIDAIAQQLPQVE